MRHPDSVAMSWGEPQCGRRAVAIYKYTKYLNASQDAEFDYEHQPGALTLVSGIYRCAGCNREVVSNYGQPLPPQNHHQHNDNQGAIRWYLIVHADPKPK